MHNGTCVTSSAKHEEQLRVRMTSALAATFEASAKLDGLTRSQAARAAIEAYCESVTDNENERPAQANRGAGRS
jgi:hypothetical protein